MVFHKFRVGRKAISCAATCPSSLEKGPKMQNVLLPFYGSLEGKQREEKLKGIE
jgi:hypothetical protein